MDIIKVLFFCAQNSACSQIAEAYLNKLGGDRFLAESAGITAGQLSPLAVAVMQEDKIDISRNRTAEILDLYKQGKSFNYVVALGDKEIAERCPVFPGVKEMISWPFINTLSLPEAEEEKLVIIRNMRDQIKKAVQELIKVASL